MHEQVTLTDEEIETRPLAVAPHASATTDTGDDSGDVSDTSDTGDDSGDVSDTSDTGDDAGDDSEDDAAA
jgi:hypothetical protein